jgi:hypothetical protein
MGLFKSRKTYFVYNRQTLEYERVFPSAKERFIIFIRNFSMGLAIGVAAFLASVYLFDSPMETMLRKENQLLQTHYDMLRMDLNSVSEVLEDLMLRDEKLYRAVLQADSIPMSIRKSGFGGSNRYDYLKGLSNSDLIVETAMKMDMLKKQLYIQSNSFEELVNLGKDLDNKLLCIPAIQPVSNKDLKRMASGFGVRKDPFTHVPTFHTGMDFTAERGTDIYATGNGKVVYVGWKQGYGNCVIIDHGYDYQTLYGHIDRYRVRAGQTVTRGDVIATVGHTGRSKAPHLHYEVIFQNRPINPVNYYQDLTPDEYDQMLQLAANHGQVLD